MQPLVSIVFPCYNASAFIRHSLESLLNQSYQNLEIICINDGSVDDTLDVLTEYQQKDKRIVIVNNDTNMGLIKTLNKGLLYVNGFYFARMDADDYSPPERIAQQVDFLSKHEGLDMVTTGSTYFTTEGRAIQYLPPVASSHKAIQFLSLFVNPVVHASLLGKTNLIRSGKYTYDAAYPHAEDFELFGRLAWSGSQIGSIDQPLYWIRINPSSVSFKYADIQVKTNVKTIKRNVTAFLGLTEFPDDLTLKLTLNKIDELPDFSNVTKAYDFIDVLRLRSNELLHFTKQEQKEIDAFLSIHKLNILIQANKIRFKALGYKNGTFYIRSLKYLRLRQLLPNFAKLKKTFA